MAKEISKTEQIAYRVLVEPWITEEATRAMEMNKYIFKVFPTATKAEIKKAVEGLYKVTVLQVRTINMPAKRRTRGRTVGTKSGFKKAIVSLKEGDSINIYEGK